MGTTLLDYTVNDVGTTTGRSGSSVCDTFAYDQANRLTQAVVGTCSTSTTSSYAYSGDGVRARKTVGAAATRYVYDLAAGLPVLLDDGTRKYVWGAAGAGLGLAYNVSLSTGATEVYHQDHLGSVREVTDGDGHITTIYLTDEYGVPTTKQAPSGQQPSDQPFWFTGELQDAGTGETGLVYLRARYYEPGIGRFVSRDTWSGSASNPASLNRYGYVGNNPTNASDPTGLRTYFIGGAGGSDDQVFRDFVGRLGRPTEQGGAGLSKVYGPVQAFDTPGLSKLDNIFSAPGLGLFPETDTDAQALAARIWYGLQTDPLAPGEQLNLIAVSGGGVVAFNTALIIEGWGVRLDHLVTLVSSSALLPSGTR